MRYASKSRGNQQSTFGLRVAAYARRRAVLNRSGGANHHRIQQESRAEPNQQESNELRQQVTELNNQLGWDKANAVCQENRRIQYGQQLDEVREQWERQKTLKEMFINRGKETKGELERLRKYSDPETLCTARIANLVWNKIKRRKKKLLQIDFEELQVAYLKNEDRFTAELQKEKNHNKLLQDKLARIRSYNKTEVLTASQQADALQHELENQRLQRTVLQKQYEELLKAHTSSQQQFTAELHEERLRNKLLQDEVEKFRAAHHDISQKYEAEVITVREQTEILQQELERETTQKTTLQKENEELQKAHTLSQEQFTSELQAQSNKNKVLQEELEKIRVSDLEIRKRYEADVVTVRQQADTLQCELQKEKEAREATIAEGWDVINRLRAEQDRLRQEMEQQINILQQNALEKERFFDTQLEELKAQLNNQISLNLELSAELEANRPPRKRARREEKSEDEPCQQQQSIFNAPAIEPKEAQKPNNEPCQQQESSPTEPTIGHPEQAEEEKIPETTKTPSMWKRTRHFLGLRKPEKWKKKDMKDNE